MHYHPNKASYAQIMASKWLQFQPANLPEKSCRKCLIRNAGQASATERQDVPAVLQLSTCLIVTLCSDNYLHPAKNFHQRMQRGQTRNFRRGWIAAAAFASSALFNDGLEKVSKVSHHPHKKIPSVAK
jgi:hypothetical protein